MIAAFVAALASGPSAAFAQRSAGDVESARQLYNQGLELRERGDDKGALEKFKAAHALGNTPITGLDLCKTHASLKQPLEAREACLSVARIAQSGAETARSQQARHDAARIAEEERLKIATVRVRLAGAPPGAVSVVTIDGVIVPAAAQSEARALNPGRHEIAARVGGGRESGATIDVSSGETKEITLTVEAPPSPPPTAPVPSVGEPPAEPARKRSVLPIVGFAVAGVGVTVGAVTGLLAMNGKSELDRKCIDKLCGRDDHAALDRAGTMADVSTASFIVGGLGLGLGLYGLISDKGGAPKRAGVQPLLGIGKVGVHGAF